jgi:hypothetical protein
MSSRAEKPCPISRLDTPVSRKKIKSLILKMKKYRKKDRLEQVDSSFGIHVTVSLGND